jgi:hypothetical protein
MGVESISFAELQEQTVSLFKKASLIWQCLKFCWCLLGLLCTYWSISISGSLVHCYLNVVDFILHVLLIWF